ncbi:MAG: hypothetical protein H0W72_06860 [Planctomycetes bacterium]|nr:hypothetical protein [Planctomycetota bacterium]
MRLALLALLLFAPLTIQAATTTESRSGFVNQKVSSRTIALNQVLRVEFVTQPKQVEGVDIAVIVDQAIEISRMSGHWRPMGKPTVTTDEKTKTISVAFALLPRKTGELPLPQVLLAWLSGDKLADFGVVTVQPTLAIGSETKDLPKEVTGVATHLWGSSLDEIKKQLPGDRFKDQGDAVVVTTSPGLDLIYRSGSLAEAVITAGGLKLGEARDSFLNRWGMPQQESAEEIQWILGWTAITAKPAADGAGTVITLRREDIKASLDDAKVKSRVFGLLDAEDTPDQAAKRRKQEIEREAERAVPGR